MTPTARATARDRAYAYATSPESGVDCPDRFSDEYEARIEDASRETPRDPDLPDPSPDEFTYFFA